MSQFLTWEEFCAEDSPADCVVPELGLCSGPIAAFVGDSYSGKTWAVMAMGLAVATGRPVWGRYPCKTGVWRHLDYEQGRRHDKSRIRRLAYGMGIGDEELRRAWEDGRIGIDVFPSFTVDLPTSDEPLMATFDGATLVTCDSIRMVIGKVDENSSVVRQYLNRLTRASEATKAACVCLHHAGHVNAMSPKSDANRGRGSTGIRDECGSQFALIGCGHGLARVVHTKDRELGALVDPFGLRIEDVGDADSPRLGARVTHLAEAPDPPEPAPLKKSHKAPSVSDSTIRTYWSDLLIKHSRPPSKLELLEAMRAHGLTVSDHRVLELMRQFRSSLNGTHSPA